MTDMLRFTLRLTGFVMGAAALGMALLHNEAQWAIASVLFFLVAK